MILKHLMESTTVSGSALNEERSDSQAGREKAKGTIYFDQLTFNLGREKKL